MLNFQDPEAGPTEEEKEKEAAAEKQKLTESPTIVVPKYNQDVWMVDPDLVELRHHISDALRAKWDVAIAAYVKGEWARAKEVLQETLAMTRNKDGPSKFLLAQIEEHGGEAPHGWLGYRDEGGGH